MVVRVDILTLAFHINFDKVTRTIELKRLFDLRVTAVDPFGAALLMAVLNWLSDRSLGVPLPSSSGR